MSLILKQETSGTIPTPVSGKATLYLDTNGIINVKDSSGSTVAFATSGGATPFSTTGNITGGNILTSGIASVTGNITGGNILTSGIVSATGNITGGNILTSGIVSATGNATFGNVTATYYGSGAGLSSITGANVTGTVANATYAVSAGSATTAATVTTAAQPNITSVGTLSSVSVSGNATVGNLNTAGAVSATGNVTGNYLLGNAYYVTGLSPTQIYNGTSNVKVTGSGTNVAVSVGGTSNVAVWSSTGEYINGLLSVTGNANVGNLGTQTISANTVSIVGAPATYSAYMNDASYVVVPGTGLLGAGNYTIEFWVKTTDTSFEIFAAEASGLAMFISSSAFYYQYSYGTGGPITVAASAILDNNWHHVALVRNSNTVTLYFDGVSQATASNSTDYSAQTFAYDIGYGNQSAGRYLLGYISNFRVVNGTAVYTTAFTPPTSPLTAITNTTLLTFQNSTLIDNSASARSLTVSGTVTYGTSVIPFAGLTGGNVSATGNLIGGNITTTGLISATGNITGGNLTTIGLVSATGNGTFGNVAAALHTGNLSGTGNSNVGNLGATGVFATTLSGSGNITGGNLVTGGLITATGNITGAVGIFNNGLSVTGNITASGNLNYQNVTNLEVGDPLIYIGANNTGNLVDLGVVASYNDGTYKHTGVARNKTNGIWTFFDGVVAEPTTVIDWANATYPTVKVGALQSTTTISVTGNANIGNIGTGGLITATGNIIGSSKILIGTGSSTLTNPVGVFQGSGATYTQLALYNSTGTGSADLVAYGNNGDDTNSWADIGFTGNGFNDANYTVTAAGDGYFFTLGNASFGGNMVIATGNLGTTKDIIFATGGFLTGNIKARLYNANGAFSVTSNVIGGNLSTAGVATVTGNITGGNLVTGGLVTSTGNVTGANIISTTNHIFSVATGISAAGSTQGTATAVSKDFNVVSTVTAGQGVVLPTAVAGMRITVLNTSAAALLVYPSTGAAVNALAANAGFSQAAGGKLDFLAVSATQWYTLNATYG